jgi:hypothetical protein
VAVAVALAASSTIDAKKRACVVAAERDARYTISVYTVSTTVRRGQEVGLARRQGGDEESPREHEGHQLRKDVDLHGRLLFV